MKKISAYYRIIQNFTCMGFFFTLIFAVKSFENAVPDEIYVRAGETVSYGQCCAKAGQYGGI